MVSPAKMSGDAWMKQQLEELNVSFDAADKDKNGSLSIQEINEILKSAGFTGSANVSSDTVNPETPCMNLITYSSLKTATTTTTTTTAAATITSARDKVIISSLFA